MSRSKKEIATELSFVMPRIARVLTSSFQHEVDLPPAQIFLLLELQEKGSCRLSDLSKALRVSAPTATGIADRLETAGLVRRDHDLKDRRVINVVLTAKGLKATKKVRQGIDQRWGYILSKMPQQDAEHYLRIVKNIQEQLQHQGE